MNCDLAAGDRAAARRARPLGYRCPVTFPAATPQQIFDDADTLAAAVAAEIHAGLEQAVQRQEYYLLGCPSGRSGAATYAALAERIGTAGTDVSGLIIVMMDEYLLGEPPRVRAVDPAEPYSGLGYARRVIAGGINAALAAGGHSSRVTTDHIWVPDPQVPEAYDRQIADAGGVDFFILASGAGDGHVAFNPPGTPLSSPSRVVELAEQTRIDNLSTFPSFGSLENVPRFGVTIGVRTLATLSRRAVMILTGEQKAVAAQRICSASGYDESWPATVVHELANANIYLDAAAAQGLTTDAGAQLVEQE